MLIRDVMNINVTRVKSGTSLQKAAEIAAFTNASDLAVVDGEDRFLGVVSEGDMMRAALPKLAEVLEAGGNVEEIYTIIEEKGKALAGMPIEEIMIRAPRTLLPSDTVHTAAALMANSGIRRLPVVESGRLVGTVSRADVCRAVFT